MLAKDLDYTINFECPCSLIVDNEGNFEIDLNLVNFNTQFSSNELTIRIISGFRTQLSQPLVQRNVRLVLTITDEDSDIGVEDILFLDGRVDLTKAFTISELDYFEDSDGDGVGDLNEQLMNTDVNNSNSKPGDSDIDILALYSASFAEYFQDDFESRIYPYLFCRKSNS